jgi:uncharacterized repeat protein (TIGR03803 family)
MCKFRFAKTAVLVFALGAVTGIVSQAQTLNTLTSFDSTDGSKPFVSLIKGSDGNFYGTTPTGGANGGGTVFKLTPGGTLTTLYNFCSQASCTDGSDPQGRLVQASDGNFYGTTYLGGTQCISGNDANSGCGTVFEISSSGTFTSVYSFCSVVVAGLCNDGLQPIGGLVQGTDGNFYGTTTYGGNNAADNNCFCGGFGVVFKLTTAGDLTTLYTFCNVTNSAGFCLDGGGPYASLVRGANGKFYGTTGGGGTGVGNNSGTIFEISPSGRLTTLYSFCQETGCPDGAIPYASLLLASNGNFYGVTRGGGETNWGTAFKLTPAGKLTTLHLFSEDEGESPYSALVQGSDGNFYGTLSTGGPYTNKGFPYGAVFKMTPEGAESTVYNFCSTPPCTVTSHGAYPYAGVVQGSNGALYGLTNLGGTDDDGTVFRISLKK